MKIKEATLEYLKSLPEREWDSTDEEWDSLLMFPSDHLHDSEWNAITIIGCTDLEPVKIITTFSADISAIFGSRTLGGFSSTDVQMECCTISKAFHIWSRQVKFKVSAALSSVDITTVPIKE